MSTASNYTYCFKWSSVKLTDVASSPSTSHWHDRFCEVESASSLKPEFDLRRDWTLWKDSHFKLQQTVSQLFCNKTKVINLKLKQLFVKECKIREVNICFQTFLSTLARTEVKDTDAFPRFLGGSSDFYQGKLECWTSVGRWAFHGCEFSVSSLSRSTTRDIKIISTSALHK